MGERKKRRNMGKKKETRKSEKHIHEMNTELASSGGELSQRERGPTTSTTLPTAAALQY